MISLIISGKIEYSQFYLDKFFVPINSGRKSFLLSFVFCFIFVL